MKGDEFTYGVSFMDYLGGGLVKYKREKSDISVLGYISAEGQYFCTITEMHSDRFIATKTMFGSICSVTVYFKNLIKL